MKEKMQHAIDAVFKMAEEQKQPSAPLPVFNESRPNNYLSRSIQKKRSRSISG
jgi:hypothetical protein